MKKLIAAMAVVPPLAACDIVLPSKTFTGGGIACWRGETKIEADANAIKAVGDLGLLGRPSQPMYSFPGIVGEAKDVQLRGLTAEQTAKLIAACKDFLR